MSQHHGLFSYTSRKIYPALDKALSEAMHTQQLGETDPNRFDGSVWFMFLKPSGLSNTLCRASDSNLRLCEPVPKLRTYPWPEWAVLLFLRPPNTAAIHR